MAVDNSAVQADFLAKAMKMDAGKYTTAWTRNPSETDRLHLPSKVRTEKSSSF